MPCGTFRFYPPLPFLAGAFAPGYCFSGSKHVFVFLLQGINSTEMRFLLNISTHAQDLSLAGKEWRDASSLLQETGFDGFSIARLYDKIEPETTVFEFSFRSRKEWVDKIHRQQRALGEVFSAKGAAS